MAEHQATKTPPSPALRTFMSATIRQALTSLGKSPAEIESYLFEKRVLLESLTAEDMAQRVLIELPDDQFVHC